MAKKNAKAAIVAEPVEEVKEVVTVNEPEVVEEVAEPVNEAVEDEKPVADEAPVELDAVPEIIELEEDAKLAIAEDEKPVTVADKYLGVAKPATPTRKTVCTNPEFRHGFGYTWNGLE